MLEVKVGEKELFDESTGEFVYVKPTILKLEHSLISLSKWESKWHKPFLENEGMMTEEEFLDYVRCMTIMQNVDNNVYLCLTKINILEIKAYMNEPMTATWFNEKQNMPKSKQRAITAELIYYWMIALGIPEKCEKWHLNRLLTLVRVCNIENSPKKKMKKNDILRQNASINQARKKLSNSKG